MADGGLFDHLGGGFYRYSVDAQWQIPHFEKMLYDNAQLLPLYCDASKAFKDGGFQRIARACADWAMGEMQAPEGGYYATLDADSEGEEGKFYVWQRDAVETLLTPPLWSIAQRYFNFNAAANFEGQWHLTRGDSVANIAQALELDIDKTRERIETVRRQLFATRRQRIAPGLDDKILTSWNGLMIGGMAYAGRVLDCPRYIASAERSFDFVTNTLWRDGRFLATTRDGITHLNAYLDDYAYMLYGGIQLLQARWRDEDLKFLLAIADAIIEHFEDPDGGGFYFTSNDHETLLQRPKSGADDAIPAGNGVAARGLLQLGHLTGETRYLEAAETTLSAFANAMTQMPAAHGSLLFALDAFANPGETVVIRAQSADSDAWTQAANAGYAPKRLVFAIPPEAGALPPALALRRAGDTPVAYLCRGLSCDEPATDLQDFRDRLGS